MGNHSFSCCLSITFGKQPACGIVSIKLITVVFSAIWAGLVSDICNINQILVFKYEPNFSYGLLPSLFEEELRHPSKVSSC